MSTQLFIDLETIPDIRPGVRERYIAESAANFKAPSSLTKEQAAKDLGMTDANEIKFTSKDAMLNLWVERFRETKCAEVADQEWRKTSFDGGRGAICVIGYAFNDDPVQTIVAISEREAIETLMAEIQEARDKNHFEQIEWVGHNIISFDLPFLWKRCVIHGIPRHIPKDSRHGAGHVFDTMTEWAGFKDRVGLGELADMLGLPNHKDGFDGSKVYDAWAAGEHLKIADYCADDVRLTRSIYQRFC